MDRHADSHHKSSNMAFEPKSYVGDFRRFAGLDPTFPIDIGAAILMLHMHSLCIGMDDTRRWYHHCCCGLRLSIKYLPGSGAKEGMSALSALSAPDVWWALASETSAASTKHVDRWTGRPQHFGYGALRHLGQLNRLLWRR